MSNQLELPALGGVKYAIFDIDGTISRTNIIKTYCFIKRKLAKSRVTFLLWLGLLIVIKVPVYACIDFFSRDLFLKRFYQKFETLKYSELSMLCKEYFCKEVVNLFIPETIELIAKLKERGLEIVLISMGISPLVDQYAAFFGAAYHCITIRDVNNQPKVVVSEINDFKLNIVNRFRASEVIAIADSKHDLPLLTYCKHAIIVANGKIKPWMKNVCGAKILPIRTR